MKKFLLFDFDGVIVDSFRPAFEVQKIKCPHLSEEEYKRRFEGNINEHNLATETHTDACRLDLDFFEHYIPKMEKEVTLVQGMAEVVQKLAQEYTLIVVSSTITLPIENLLQKYGLRECFVGVMGNDVHKSKVEKIKMVFAKYGVGAQDCLFITDTLGDMLEAEKTGVAAVGVTWGFHTPSTLEKGLPYKLVTTPKELLSTIGEYFTTPE